MFPFTLNIFRTDALQAILPKQFITAENVTTDKIDDLIDSCIKDPIDVPAGTKPILEQFIKKLTSGAKEFASYLFIFPGMPFA